MPVHRAWADRVRSGGIKPCVGVHGRPVQAGAASSAAQGIRGVYWCINLGSTAAFLIIPLIRSKYGYGWAFGVPGICHGHRNIRFLVGRKRYTMVPPSSKTRSAGFFRCFFFALANRHQRQPGQKFWDVVGTRFRPRKWMPPSRCRRFSACSHWYLCSGRCSIRLFHWVMQGEKMLPKTLAPTRLVRRPCFRQTHPGHVVHSHR